MISKLGDYDDTLQRVDAQQDALKKSFVINFIPALESGANALTGIMSDASTALEDGFQPEDIKTIGASITGVFSGMMKGLGAILPEVSEVITTLITEAIGIVGDLLPVMLPVLIDSAFVLLQSLMDAIGENVQPIADMVTQLVLALVNFFVENIPVIIDLALQIIIALATGLAEALPELIPAVIDMVLQIVDIVLQNIGLIIEVGLQILIALIQGLAEAIPDLIAYLPTLITTIVTVLIENLPLIIGAAIQILLALIQGLIESIPLLITAMPDIINAIVTAFTETDWASYGSDILAGVGEGIMSAVSGVVESAKSAAASIAGAIGDFFGISSPSKLMMEDGEYISEGLAIGIKRKAGLAQDALDGLLPPTLNPKVSAELMSSSEVGGTVKKTIEHTGVIRVEGINSEGQLISAVEILISQMRRESMMAGTI
jgi:phage-related protein